MQLSDSPNDLVHGEIITLPEADLPAIDLYQHVEAMAMSEAGTKSSAYCYVMKHLPSRVIRINAWLY